MLCVVNSLILCISKYFRNNKNIYLYSKASIDVDSSNSKSLVKSVEGKEEDKDKLNKEENHSIINDDNNKNNFKELEIKEIEKIPIKDSNNLDVVLRKNSNSKESIISKEKANINFETLYQELKDAEAEAIETRIESYELKGFNAMEPTIKNPNQTKLEKTSISTLYDKKNIDMNYMTLMKISKKELDELDNIHSTKIKPKEINFDKIILESIEINKYGNANLINCIYMLIKKDRNYFHNLFSKFDVENNLFEFTYYQHGQEEKIILCNKVIKNTMFIKPDETNFWIYLIEKTIAKIYKHYINTYNLLASELYQNLTPLNIKILSHIYYEKKEIFNEIKNNLNTQNIIFCEIDALEISQIDDINNIFTSFYITNIFKLNGRKYVELFLPYNKSNKSQKEISINSSQNEIHEEDIKNTEYFPEAKINDNHYYFITFDTFLINFSKTYILEYSKNFVYLTKKLKISDSNIDFLKFRVTGGRGIIKLCAKFNFPRCYLCRCILAKLTITENVIRNSIVSNQSQDNENENDVYFEELTDYDFEYLDGFYGHGLVNKFDIMVENGTYCLIFNIYTNNGFELNISLLSYSKGADIEFLDTKEKISGENLNAQIKTLFVSYMKKNMYNNVIKKRIKDNAFSYQSLYNQKIGYSIFMIENGTDKYNILVDLITENTGMNLITKEYEEENMQNLINGNSKLIKIIVPPKNSELIIFEWEKTVDNIYINLSSNITAEKIENIFSNKNYNFNSYKKKYIEETNVYFIEVEYRKGIFIIFVNESENDEYIIDLGFDNVFNIKYKNYENDDLKEKEFSFRMKKMNYHFLKLKAIKEGEYGYDINLKIKKINQINQINQ